MSYEPELIEVRPQRRQKPPGVRLVPTLVLIAILLAGFGLVQLMKSAPPLTCYNISKDPGAVKLLRDEGHRVSYAAGSFYLDDHAYPVSASKPVVLCG